MATLGAILSVVAWLAVVGVVLYVALVLKALSFAVIQRHGAVMIKFLVIWIVAWLVVGLVLGAIIGPVAGGSRWHSVGVASGFLIAAAICFATARRPA